MKRRAAVLHIDQNVEKWLLWVDKDLFFIFILIFIKKKHIFDGRSYEYAWRWHSFGSLPVETRQNQALTPVSGECITYFWRSSEGRESSQHSLLNFSKLVVYWQRLPSLPIFMHASLFHLWVFGTLKLTRDWRRQVKRDRRTLAILCTLFIS